MKPTIILLFVCSVTFGQCDFRPTHKPGFIDRIPEPVKVITLFSASIVLDAVGDGLYDNGDKTAGHAFQAMSTGILLTSPIFLNMDKDNFWWYLVSYVSLRIGLFDYSYNLTRGLPMSYVGTSSISDKFQQKFNPGAGHLWFPKTIFFTLGVVIPINEL